MKSKIAEQDLDILKKLFISETSELEIQDNDDCFEVDSLKDQNSKKMMLRSLIVSGRSKFPEKDSHYVTVVEFGKSTKWNLKFKHEFRFIRVNGAIRWVYPKGQMKSIFDFYHASTTRGKLIKLGLRIVSLLRLDRLISKRITIHSITSNCLSISPKSIPVENFSIFMGTSGVERTALVALLTNNKSTHFLKVGLNSISSVNVGNELNTLYKLNRESLKKTVIPVVKSTNVRGVLVMSKLEERTKKVTNAFTPQHAESLLELADLSRTNECFHESVFGETIINNCLFLEQNIKNEVSLTTLLLKCLDDIPHDYQFSAGLAHGDFTPWNMFLSKDKLYLYDWESSMKSAPSLFDLFHYHFRTGNYLTKWSFNEVYAQIKFSIEVHPIIKEEIKTYSIDVKRHLQLYLLFTISRQLALQLLAPSEAIISEGQQELWRDALIFISPKTADHRKGFITEFEVFLSDVHHAFLKFDAGTLASLPASSDLDIAIHNSALSRTVKFCNDHPLVKRCKRVKKSFMTTLELFFEDNRYLSIDLIHDFRRKSIRFMDMNELLHFSSKNKMGISVPSLQHDIEYTMMFYTLNGANVPAKYIELFKGMKRDDHLRTLRYFQQKYMLEFSSIEELLNAHDRCYITFKTSLKKRSIRSLFPRLNSNLNYLLDTVKGQVGKRGFMLTVSGVDGVGKTTVIDLVKEQLQAKYRKEVILMRHRPKVLPILSAFKHGGVSRAESKASHLDPNKVTNKSVMGSYLRFFYYYFDYLIGQLYVHVRYIWGGKIVLYDRYYFDLINHPERTNLVVNQKFAKWLYRPILKPSLNIFLNASPEEIVKRKQELNTRQISKLTDKYLSLFRELSRRHKKARYVVHRNDNLSKTVTEILQDIQQIA